MLSQFKMLFRAKRNKPFAFMINGIGLLLAFTVIIVMFSYAYLELNHDSDVLNRDNIVQVETSVDWNLVPGPFGPWLASAMPEVEQFCRIHIRDQVIGVPAQENVKEILSLEKVIIADTSYASLFSLQFLQGGVQDGIDNVILSERTALKFFGKSNPIGKRLVMNNSVNLTVSGVFRDVNNPALYQPKIIVSVYNPQMSIYRGLHFWEGNNFETYLRLKENTNHELVNARFRELYADYLKEARGYTPEKIEAALKIVGLRDYTDAYFEPKVVEYSQHGNLANIRILLLIAVLILLVSIINYVNIATAKVADQSRNISLKRTLGSGRFSLVFSIVLEAVVICFLAMLVAFFIVRLVAGRLEAWTGMMDVSMNWKFVAVLLLVVPVICGILSGLFPAIYLTRISNLVNQGKESFTLRRFKSVLTVVQFAISIGLVITTLFIYKQMNYVKTLDPGYDRDNVLVVYGDDYSKLSAKYPEFRNLLLQNPAILKVGISRDPVYNLTYGEFTLKLAGWEKGQGIPAIHADTYLPDALGMKVSEGMEISQENVEALNGKVLINRQLANAITALQPRQHYLEGERVSVLEDFHYQSMYAPVGPLYFRLYSPEQFVKGRAYVYIRFSPERQDALVAYVKDCFEKLLPNELYRYDFLMDSCNRLYGADDLFANRLLIFSIFSIVIACLGLLAFVAFFIEQNMKNIGIRKVVGATEVQILGLLNRGFLSRLLAGFLICCPVVYLLLTNWLSRFAYKTTLSWWVFVAAFMLISCIALLCVSTLTWKAATVNPVDSLKSE